VHRIAEKVEHREGDQADDQHHDHAFKHPSKYQYEHAGAPALLQTQPSSGMVRRKEPSGKG
jgi:hypothetical protein